LILNHNPIQKHIVLAINDSCMQTNSALAWAYVNMKVKFCTMSDYDIIKIGNKKGINMQRFIINASLKQKLEENIRQHKNTYVFNGVVFMVLGLVSLTSPLIAAEFFDFLIGTLLLVTGLAQAAVSMKAKRHWSYYLSAVVSITAGSLMIAKPNEGALALAAIIAIFLLFQGVLQIFSAGMYAPFKGWLLMLASGVISIILAILIYASWPSTALWFLGLVVAINLISFGFSIIMLTNYMTK